VVHEFADREVVLGSDAACDVVVTGGEVSPEHCKIQPVMGAWKIIDLESDAGTRVNGAYVNQRPLRAGDVLELGDVRIVFHDDPVAAAPPAARAPAARSSSSRAGGARRSAQQPARRAAPANRRGAPSKRSRGARERDTREDDEQERERPARRPRKKSNSGQTVALTIGAVIILAGAGYLMLKPTTSSDEQVFMRMQAAETKMDWQAVLSESQAGNVGDPMFGQRIAALKAKAEQQIKNDLARERVPEATAAWNDLRLWLQDDNWKNHDEYVTRLDAFLAEYGDVGGISVQYARSERAKITGSTGGGVSADAAQAWSVLQNDLTALKGNGQFGEAIKKAEEFSTKWAGQDPVLGRQARELQKTLPVDAKKWVGLQISKAQQKMDYGAPLQARKILEKAVQVVGIPELEDRAAKAMAELKQ